VPGRGGSGSFGSGRTAGYAIGEDRTSPWLEAIAGIRQRSCPRLGSKPVPAPRTRYLLTSTRYETCLRRVFTAATVSSTPFRAPVSVCGAGCAGLFPKRVCCFFDWGNIWESGSRDDLRNRVGQSVHAGQSVQGVSLEEPCYFAQVGTTLPLVE
jgi:hypothetical protein